MTYLYLILTIVAIYLFKAVIFNLIAKGLGAVLNPFNILIVAYNERKTNNFIKAFNNYNMQDAMETDIFLHYNLRSLWNATLSKGGTPFGYIDSKQEKLVTLSARIGQKKLENTLTKVGIGLYGILYAIDFKNWKWFYKKQGHCIEAYNKIK